MESSVFGVTPSLVPSLHLVLYGKAETQELLDDATSQETEVFLLLTEKSEIGYFRCTTSNCRVPYHSPGLKYRDNQRQTALFQRFDLFQRWFRKHEKHQRRSALFKSWSGLTLSDSALFRTEQIGALFRVKQLRINAAQRWFSLLWNIGFSALNGADSALVYSEIALILIYADENVILW